MKARVEYLDQMKGIAIWLMVIGHVMIFSFKMENTSVQQMLEIFHMPIFFFISGYLAYKAIPKFQDMYKRLRHKFVFLVLPLASAVIIRYVFKPAELNWLVTDFWWYLYILLIYLGRKSLGIYVFYNFFIAGVGTLFNPLMNIENAFVWQLLLTTLLSLPAIVCSLFVTNLVEHNSFLNYIIFGRKLK